MRIEHQCPQCGAPAILMETDRLFVCEYCRVTSCLLTTGCFCYVLPHNAPADKELVFFPYWRVRGMLFSCLSKEIRHRAADITHQAVESLHFPPGVGLRSQALKLRFASSETKGHFLKPSLSMKAVLSTLERHLRASLPEPASHQVFVGDPPSLIYAPFYLAKTPNLFPTRNSQNPECHIQLFDAVLDKPLPGQIPDHFDISDFPKRDPEWQIRMIPALCPRCGWNLDGERDTLAFICRNCAAMWQPDRAGFDRVPAARFPGPGDVLLPFWKIRAKISGTRLDSYADMVQVANLPRVVKERQRADKFCFWAPAFKIRARIFLNLSRNMTLSQPREKLIPGIPDTRHWPVTLPITAAVESLKISLASFMKPRKKCSTLLPKIRITPKKWLLAYVPFHEHHHELVQSDFQLTVHKNMLKMAKNL